MCEALSKFQFQNIQFDCPIPNNFQLPEVTITVFQYIYAVLKVWRSDD